MAASPGAYALLLGSGVSRAAAIPTGWEVTKDLARRVAVYHGQDLSPDESVDWYRTEFSHEPSHSDLLGELGMSAADRQNLLRGYFEPTEEDRENKLKVPTRAHHAIAQLAGDGVIKLVLTTNFDRLLEEALDAEGVRYQVIAHGDQIQGAAPLPHAPFTLVKLHGDYRDSRIRNTVDELDEYELALDRFLDRVFDEYGLLVCGWSAEWDMALVRALKRSTPRRFGFFWAARGELSQEAAQLVDAKTGHVLHIPDADVLFVRLREAIKSIEELGGEDILTPDLAEATIKRYLPRAERRIELEDLVRTHLNDFTDWHASWPGSGEQSEKYLEEIEELAARSAVCQRLLSQAPTSASGRTRGCGA